MCFKKVSNILSEVNRDQIPLFVGKDQAQTKPCVYYTWRRRGEKEDGSLFSSIGVSPIAKKKSRSVCFFHPSYKGT